MVELKEDSYILGYWMTSYDDVDIYVIAYKEGDKYIAQQTFRYHSGNDDPYSGEDKKSITTIKLPDDIDNDDKAIKACDFINKIHTEIPGTTYNFTDKTIIKGDPKEFYNKMKDKPYMHFKEVPSDSV